MNAAMDAHNSALGLVVWTAEGFDLQGQAPSIGDI